MQMKQMVTASETIAGMLGGAWSIPEKQRRSSQEQAVRAMIKSGKIDSAWAYWLPNSFDNLDTKKVNQYNNPTEVHQCVAFVIQATDNWEWLQSEVYDIGPGYHTVVFKVDHLNKNFDQVKRINITNYMYQEHKTDNNFYVDNIRLIK